MYGFIMENKNKLETDCFYSVLANAMENSGSDAKYRAMVEGFAKDYLSGLKDANLVKDFGNYVLSN
jgi:hypothetical protein